MTMEKLLLILVACVGLSVAMPTGAEDGDTEMTDGEIKAYLDRFGYLTGNPMVAQLTSEEALPMAIAEFQTMAGLPPTGKLDDETRKMMGMERCGNRDVDDMQSFTRRRKRRYLLQGGMWSKGVLTWRISKYTPDLSRENVDSDARRAFQLWSSVTNLDFRQLSDNSNERVDIDISFVPQYHGDGFPFDGSRGDLAHAYYPWSGGDVHMDEAEYWTFNTNYGINVFQVIAHEFGHSLGLAHSSSQSALMAPFYRGYIPDFELDQDDIKGIQALYGVRMSMNTDAPGPNPTNPPTPPPMPPVNPDIAPMPCNDGGVDAIVMTEDERVYVFRANYYVELDDNGIVAGYPRRIGEDWLGLPDNVDAAITFDSRYGYVYDRSSRRYSLQKLLDERIYFFKGSQAYLFEPAGRTYSMVAGYPKPISTEFPGLPDNLDAAFRWSRNNRPYFMKGGDYYRYSNGRIVSVDNGFDELPGMVDANYPRDLDVWKGLPQAIDAAFVGKNGRTYFFKDDQHWRFNDRYLQVDSGYPRSTRGAWFGCTGQLVGDEQTTMMMEADMSAESMLETFDGSEDEVENKEEDNRSSQAALYSHGLLALFAFICSTLVIL